MANRPRKSKPQKNPLDRIPVRKLAAGLRKQLIRKLKEKYPDLELGKPRKD
ncbi:MAG TPA: hypothetical protein VMB18_05220 [Terriglobales bacterium]|nr:hypothetical protein [Terriglobales bacterium]